MVATFSRISASAALVLVGVLASAAPVQANPIPLFPIETVVVTFDAALADRFFIDNFAFGTFGLEDTLEFDEVPFQPIDGLTVTAPSGNSVTFGFTVGGTASDDANYNSFGPGTLTYVQDPVLEGTTSGVLTAVFAVPISFISFGLAVSTFDPGIAAIVHLFLEDGTDLSTIQQFDNLVEVESLVSFSEGTFAIPSAPEPGSLALMVTGLVAAARRARRVAGRNR